MWNEEEDAEYNNEASAAWIAVKSNAEQARLGVKEEAGVEDDDEEGGAGAVARWSKRGQPFCQVCAGQGGVPRCFLCFGLPRCNSRTGSACLRPHVPCSL